MRTPSLTFLRYLITEVIISVEPSTGFASHWIVYKSAVARHYRKLHTTRKSTTPFGCSVKRTTLAWFHHVPLQDRLYTSVS
ncbi:hypothetical protein BIW11_13478 [Tropilaelaps mercedesae]|uniref:Uncharacterized protein n=1 Tax=Tropilaelaps mercedesae TaxID=418985 RepID=A0A1V9X2A2_9ACAR|nr:hypothetical protein BIW11_13478 [Tropilaelaps mercedesae]